jgi:hypothetical protein
MSSEMRKAMDRVMSESKDMSIAPVGKDEESTVDKQVLIRASSFSRERWKMAADKSGVTLSAWIRHVLDNAASDLLDCSHPINRRKYYPWAEFCLECGMRISNK